MGLIDALALGLVTAAGSLPKAEYASVSSSLFGVLTVLLAVWFLKEHARPVQWLGIATVSFRDRGAGVAKFVGRACCPSSDPYSAASTRCGAARRRFCVNRRSSLGLTPNSSV
jgi:hypothetical protein